jgi:hypothetical protein
VFEQIFGGNYDYLIEQGVAHETAHVWWGTMASASDNTFEGFHNTLFPTTGYVQFGVEMVYKF